MMKDIIEKLAATRKRRSLRFSNFKQIATATSIMEAESAVKPKNEVVRLLRNDFCRDAQSRPRAFLRV